MKNSLRDFDLKEQGSKADDGSSWVGENPESSL